MARSQWRRSRRSQYEKESNLNLRMKAGRKSLLRRIEAGEIVVTSIDKSGKLAFMHLALYEEMGKTHTDKDKEISEHEVSRIQQDLNKHARLIMKIFGIGEQHKERNNGRVTSAFTTNAEDVPQGPQAGQVWVPPLHKAGDWNCCNNESKAVKVSGRYNE